MKSENFGISLSKIMNLFGKSLPGRNHYFIKESHVSMNSRTEVNKCIFDTDGNNLGDIESFICDET